jgi:hypothetical protein
LSAHARSSAAPGAALKGKILAVALCALTAWPAVHIYLVKRFDLSPWKLGGWGMYASPRFGMLGMEVYGRTGADAEWTKLTAPSAELRNEATVFLERYRWLRRLARPDALTQGALQAHPEWRELRVIVFQPELDKQTGMVVMKQVSYDYPRG